MPSGFFADGHVNRPIEPDTVARGQLRDDGARFTGQTGPGSADAPDYATEFPYPVDKPMLERGRERFNIYCSVCHGRIGDGDGMIVRRGYLKPPSYHTDDARGYHPSGRNVPLRDVPVGYFFAVMTRGYGGMPDYAEQIPVDDRWAIAAYIRVLQYSQHVPAGELTDADRERLRAADQPKNGAEGTDGH
jgi:mono/diheme cytochrome c family protein